MKTWAHVWFRCAGYLVVLLFTSLGEIILATGLYLCGVMAPTPLR